jgi:hypothetical protein
MASLGEVDEAKLSDYISRLFVNIDNIPSVESAAGILAKGMCDIFKPGKKSELALSRVFHSFEYEALPPDIKEAAKKSIRKTPENDSLFMTLLGTYGDEPAWQDRKKSHDHKAILLTYESLKKIPMMSRVFQQVGFDLGIASSKGAAGMIFSGLKESYGIFHVPEAQDSPYITDQDFVREYDIRSVFGSAVKLPGNDVSAYIGFSRAQIDEDRVLYFLPLMSFFWQKAFPLIGKGFFNE